ncbi:hydrogenase formation protein HypD [Devriesea agamarum]|uniref:hydrogenase formation protein HypD n=1 Tax=Devriesea agamarum TaxID=472569 RepID=UPI00071CB138|nr:hydrogenase formation protein HypD [Devriesea agamarum]
MKYVDEFRNPQAARELLHRIDQLANQLERPHAFMEVCGGHTHTIYRHGLEQLMPAHVEFIHGPGCPVCVIPMGRVDDALWLARQPDVIFTTFGDMMRVPGTQGSLLDAKASGSDVRFVYSPLDALKIARDNPDRDVVFFAVGFETTAPSTAVTIARARRDNIKNFSIFCNHVRIEPPLRAILNAGDSRIDGFIGPGHVATVVGSHAFEFVPSSYGLPVVVTGFEPLDILQSVVMLVEQYVSGDVAAGRARVENQYARVVRDRGNEEALSLLEDVFVHRETFEWRGLGFIEDSGLGIRDEYADFDAEKRYALPGRRVADPPACECGSVLVGAIKPWECKVFGTACTPQKPIGTCMVSPEGACAAYYNFGRLDRATARAVAQQ